MSDKEEEKLHLEAAKALKLFEEKYVPLIRASRGGKSTDIVNALAALNGEG